MYRSLLSLGVIVAAPLTSIALPAQIDWTITPPSANSPVPMRGHASALHEGRSTAVVVGGLVDPFMSTPSTQFFEFDGVTWKSGNMPPTFAGRWRTAMAYHPGTGSLILFGGDAAGNITNDTWALSSAGVWSQLTPATSPRPREGHTMVLDAARGVIVMFGGRSIGAPLNETWEWNGTNWVLVAATTPPPGRFYHSAAFDRTWGRTVVYGGVAAGPALLNDTWTYDGVAWTLQPAALPAARIESTMAFDRVRRRVVLFGGVTTGFNNDTFDLVGATPGTAVWTPRPTATLPTARGRFASAELPVPGPINSDATTFFPGHVLIVGGQSGSVLVTQGPTFLVSTPEPSLQTIGVGCAGSFGVPTLTADQPIAGLTWTLRAALVPNTFASLSMGINALVNPPIALPGMPGCFAYGIYSGSFGTTIVPQGGGFAAVAAVPIIPALVGTFLDAQMAIVDPGVNPANVIVSNAVRGSVGGL